MIDGARKSGRELPADAAPAEPADEAALPDESYELRETAAGLRAKLLALPPQQREAFELVKGEGLSLAQAAQVLGVTVTAVKLRLHRAYETLRAELREPSQLETS